MSVRPRIASMFASSQPVSWAMATVGAQISKTHSQGVRSLVPFNIPLLRSPLRSPKDVSRTSAKEQETHTRRSLACLPGLLDPCVPSRPTFRTPRKHSCLGHPVVRAQHVGLRQRSDRARSEKPDSCCAPSRRPACCIRSTLSRLAAATNGPRPTIKGPQREPSSKPPPCVRFASAPRVNHSTSSP